MAAADDGTRKAPAGVSFRTALLVTVLAILLATVGVIGVVSFWNARFIVVDLGGHVLRQTAERIHDRVLGLVDRAALVGDVHCSLLCGRRITAADFPEIIPEFHSSILQATELSYLSLGLETGAYCHVHRMVSGGMEIRTQELQEDGRTLRRDWRLEGRRMVEVVRAYDEYDPRVRPWYRRAVDKGRQTWPEVYVFINAPNPDSPGLTCATPVRDPAGKIQGVSTADFDLIALSRFLRDLRIFEAGMAFVVETREDGSRRVVAHPDPEVILGHGSTGSEILPLERIRSAPVRTMLERIRLDEKGDDEDGLVEVVFEADDVRYVGGYLPLRSRHDLRWHIGIVVPRDDLMRPVERSSLHTLLIGIASLLTATLLVIWLARRISHPLGRLAQETEAIAAFQLEARPQAASRLLELRRLANGMEEMKAGLRSFQRFVPTEVVRAVLASGRDVALGGERRVLSVSFSDIAGFTDITERLDPDDLVSLLGDYFGAMTEEVAETGGTVDKYVGDAVMAFWGAPGADDEHALHACLAALAGQRRLVALREAWRARGLPEAKVRTGIATGEATVGTFGSPSRFNYTALGDTVNLASRLEGLNKFYSTSILASDATAKAVAGRIVTRPIERVAVRGRQGGVLVHEVLARREEADDDVRTLAQASADALSLYEAREFRRAEEAYGRVLAIRPDDAPALLLQGTCLAFSVKPPPKDWDAIRRM